MYNSLTLRICVKIGDAFTLAYKESIFKSIVDAFKKGILYLINGSILIDIFTKNLNFIETSLFYRLFSMVADLGTNIFKRLNKLFKKLGNESIVYKSASKLFGTSIDLIRSLAVFVLFFAIGVILNNLIRGAFSGRSYIVSLGFIFVTVIVIVLGEGLERLLNNSFVYRWIMDLFVIDDEGGDQWW